MAHFNPEQLSELREIAFRLIRDRKWDELSWEHALSGFYPIRPTTAEVEQETNLLVSKASRILQFGFSDQDYLSTEEHTRIIYLESCSFIKLNSV